MHSRHTPQRLTCSLVLTLAMLSPNAVATTAGVPGPNVSATDRSVEYRTSLRPDEGARPAEFSHRLHYQHGLSDTRRLRVMAQQGKREGSDWELRYTRAEYQWQYQSGEGGGASSALRFDLQLVEGDDEPHFARVAWITQFNLGEARTRFNVFVRRDFGDRARSGLALQTRGEMTWRMNEQRIGFQMFNGFNTTSDVGGFDEQSHQIGPVLSGRAGEWRWFASYLAGVSDRAPDGAVRFFIGRSL